MKKDEAIKRIYNAAKIAKEQNVKVQFIISSDDINRPLKTVSGVIKKLNAYSRNFLWNGWLIIEYVGNNGKTYKNAKTAVRLGNKK